MINLSVYTDNVNMIILFYEDTNKKYQKSLSYRCNEFHIQKYFRLDFDMEKQFFTELNEYELFFNEKYKEIISKMINKFNLLIDKNTDEYSKPHFWRGKLHGTTKCITHETGLKYAQQIMKEFNKKYEDLIGDLYGNI